jgi:hypothetical protein
LIISYLENNLKKKNKNNWLMNPKK